MRQSCPVKLNCPMCQAGFSVQRKLTKHLKICTAPAPHQLGSREPLQDGDQPAPGGEQPPPLLLAEQPPLNLPSASGDLAEQPPPRSRVLPSASGDKATKSHPEKLIGEETDYAIFCDIDLPIDPNIHRILDVGSLDDLLNLDIDFGSN